MNILCKTFFIRVALWKYLRRWMKGTSPSPWLTLWFWLLFHGSRAFPLLHSPLEHQIEAFANILWVAPSISGVSPSHQLHPLLLLYALTFLISMVLAVSFISSLASFVCSFQTSCVSCAWNRVPFVQHMLSLDQRAPEDFPGFQSTNPCQINLFHLSLFCRS